jgi:hypothetical protein
MCPERFVTYVSGRSPLNLPTLLFSTPAFGLALVLAPSWPQLFSPALSEFTARAGKYAGDSEMGVPP